MRWRGYKINTAEVLAVIPSSPSVRLLIKSTLFQLISMGTYVAPKEDDLNFVNYDPVNRRMDDTVGMHWVNHCNCPPLPNGKIHS